MGSCITISCCHRAGDEGANALLTALAAACDFAAAAALPETMTRRLAIIVEEIVSNVLEHGPAGHEVPLMLRLDQRAEGLFVTLEDESAAFDPRTAPLCDMPNPDRGGGVGLALVKAWSEIVAYDREGERNRLVLHLNPCDDPARSSSV